MKWIVPVRRRTGESNGKLFNLLFSDGVIWCAEPLGQMGRRGRSPATHNAFPFFTVRDRSRFNSAEAMCCQRIGGNVVSCFQFRYRLSERNGNMELMEQIEVRRRVRKDMVSEIVATEVGAIAGEAQSVSSWRNSGMASCFSCLFEGVVK